MIELKANIWDKQFDGCWRVIPINCQVNSKGELIMGAGLAREAKNRYSTLPEYWGRQYKDGYTGLDPYSPNDAIKLLAFPTKDHWKDDSDIRLIAINLKSLYGLYQAGYLEKIVCPRLGCGLGKLDWDTQVKPLVEKYFGDDPNFIVVNL